MVWIAFAVVVALAILVFGAMPTWVRMIRYPKAGPRVDFTVTIEGGPGGSVWYREGPHEHGPGDFMVLLDFADQVFFNKPSKRDWNANPFPDHPAAFKWSAPKAE